MTPRFRQLIDFQAGQTIQISCCHPVLTVSSREQASANGVTLSMWAEHDNPGQMLTMATNGNGRFSMVKTVSLDDLQDYIEGRLTGADALRVEAYLHEHPAKAAQVDALKRQASRLRKLGEDILSEPIPSQFLDILKRLPK